jgi:hypothetical protein
MSEYRNEGILKYQNIEIWEYRNVRILKCQNIEMSEYRNVRISKCRNIEMSEYRKGLFIKTRTMWENEGLGALEWGVSSLFALPMHCAKSMSTSSSSSGDSLTESMMFCPSHSLWWARACCKDSKVVSSMFDALPLLFVAACTWCGVCGVVWLDFRKLEFVRCSLLLEFRSVRPSTPLPGTDGDEGKHRRQTD